MQCDAPNDDNPIPIVCPYCEGEGCKECDKGMFEVNQCPMHYIGSQLTRDINLTIFASDGHLPEGGGILDQDAKFLYTWQAFRHDVNKIQNDRRERRNSV